MGDKNREIGVVHVGVSIRFVWEKWSTLKSPPRWLSDDSWVRALVEFIDGRPQVFLDNYFYFFSIVEEIERLMASVDLPRVPVVLMDSILHRLYESYSMSYIEGKIIDNGPIVFVYSGDLSPDLGLTLNRCRLKGCPVLPLSLESIQASIVDRSSGQLYRELEQRYFKPQNLFIQHSSLNDRNTFYGHESRITLFGDAVSRGDAVLLTGLRKSGKSSLLRMMRQAQPELPWCWVDLQRFDPEREDWAALLFSALLEAVDRWGRVTFSETGWPLELPASIQTASALSEAMQRRLDLMRENGVKSPRVVLVLDELERVLPRGSDPEVSRRWVRATGALRQAAETGERWLTILAADLRPTATRLNILPSGETNPFYQFFREVPLPLFTLEQSREMLEGLGQIMGVCDIAPGFHERLSAITAGHPYLTRLIAGRSYEKAQDTTRLTEADLDRGLDEMDERWELGSFFEQNLWNFATDAERALLRWVDQSGRPAGRRPPPELGMRRSEWMAARAALTDQGILKDGEIVLGGFREWLHEEFSGAA